MDNADKWNRLERDFADLIGSVEAVVIHHDDTMTDEQAVSVCPHVKSGERLSTFLYYSSGVLYDPRQTTEPEDAWSHWRHYVLHGNIADVRRFSILAGECGEMTDETFGGVDARTLDVSRHFARWLFTLADLFGDNKRHFLAGGAIASKEMTLAMNLVDNEEAEELSVEIEQLKKLGWYCVISDAAHASQRAIQFNALQKKKTVTEKPRFCYPRQPTNGICFSFW